jgi:anaphase-promoting complex subunit 1
VLEEIGRRAGDERPIDRDAHALTAGFALGCVALGQGSAAVLADLRLIDRLAHFIDGGALLPAAAVTRARAIARLTRALCQAAAAAANDAAALAAAASVRNATASVGGANSAAGTGHAAGLVHEGARVNTDLTAPGATLALGLLYLRTNDAAVAARLAVPRSRYLLTFVRGDFVMLRVLAHSLVMWDAIVPTDAWLRSHVPAFLARAFDDVIGVPARAPPPPSSVLESATRGALADDAAALHEAAAFAIGGACSALGMRYAGSGDHTACTLLQRVLRRFERLTRRAAAAATTNTAAGESIMFVSRGTAEMCVDVCAVALGCVMAGTGDLGTLRLLRALRQRVSAELTYGSHMAVGIALGLLFLSGGCATLSTSNDAVAALVIAFYPRWPAE